MNIYKMRFGLHFIIAALILAIVPGCDNADTEDDVPEVIPPEVFSLPVDLFDQSATAKTGAPKINFTAAALRVWPVSLLMTANLIIPSVATSAALQADPVFQGDVWEWSSSATANGQTIGFVLSADRNGGSTDWSMKINMTDPVTSNELVDFELFSAQTSNNGQSGSWSLFYYLNEQSQNVLDAEYVITSDTEKYITFSIPESAAQNAGDSVRYEENGDERTFLWQQVDQGISHTVTWNHVTKEGSIIATNYNNGEVSCWDADFEDVACAGS